MVASSRQVSKYTDCYLNVLQEQKMYFLEHNYISFACYSNKATPQWAAARSPYSMSGEHLHLSEEDFSGFPFCLWVHSTGHLFTHVENYGLVPGDTPFYSMTR